MSFDSFDFHPRIMQGIKSTGYTTPTPIQREAMPAILAGQDVMGLAQTGTGKTAAFLLPILQRFAQNPRSQGAGVRALVVAPTRELADQIHESALELGRHMRLKTATVYGGVSMGPQVMKLRNGAELVVACPGRLIDHLGQRSVDLSRVEVLVLDEADHMFDMGFLPDLKRILACLPKERQTLLFSATMPSQIRRLAEETLTDPKVFRIGREAPATTVCQACYPVASSLKPQFLLALLNRFETGSVLVFTRTKHRAKRLAQVLERSGYSATSLQGNLSQNQRKAALDGFRDGKFRVLVATDIAARGIDVTRVGHVVNFDIPDTPEAYTHRIGRTGRAERTGEAHSLITREDASMLRAIESLIGRSIERRTLEGFDYSQAPPEDLEAGRRPLPQRQERFTPRPRGGEDARSSARPSNQSQGRRSGSSNGRDSGAFGLRPARAAGR